MLLLYLLRRKCLFSSCAIICFGIWSAMTVANQQTHSSEQVSSKCSGGSDVVVTVGLEGCEIQMGSLERTRTPTTYVSFVSLVVEAGPNRPPCN